MGRIENHMIERFEVIEGATPISDCSGLKLEGVHNQNDLNRVEAENIMKAQRKYLFNSVDNPKKWFQVEKLINIHKDMLGDVWDWAGTYRKSITSIGIKPGFINIINYIGSKQGLLPRQITK